jgi:tetratricopeptide (TPR) repeat protein
MSSETELSDLMVAAYTHQKNDEISLAIQAWNTLINHQAADKNLSANAHLSLGHLHQLQGNDDLAIESISNAIKANPNSSEAHFCLAHTAQKEENFEMAITHFESALTLNSQDCGAFNNLGNCDDRLEKTTEAIEAYSKLRLSKSCCANIFALSKSCCAWSDFPKRLSKVPRLKFLPSLMTRLYRC